MVVFDGDATEQKVGRPMQKEDWHSAKKASAQKAAAAAAKKEDPKTEYTYPSATSTKKCRAIGKYPSSFSHRTPAKEGFIRGSL